MNFECGGNNYCEGLNYWSRVTSTIAKYGHSEFPEFLLTSTAKDLCSTSFSKLEPEHLDESQ